MRRTVLPGGLRVVTEFLPSVRSVALGIWVGVGSRDEDTPHAGATHYLEHLLFKGTRKRTALEISAEMDAVGGEMNAFTAKEYTCYYARVLDADLPLAIDVLSDMVTSSLIEPKDVDAERDVMLEEIAMNEDDPSDVGARGVHRAALRRHAARPADPRHGGLDQRDHQGADLRALPGQVHATAPGGLGGREPGPRHRGRPWFRRPSGRRSPTSAAPSPRPRGCGTRRPLGRLRPGGRLRRVADLPADRAGQPGARLRGAVPHRRPAVRPRRAQRGARRRHVLPAVPGGAREARPGLRGLQLRLPARRHRPVGHLRRLPAVQGRRRAVDLHVPRWPRSSSPG